MILHWAALLSLSWSIQSNLHQPLTHSIQSKQSRSIHKFWFNPGNLIQMIMTDHFNDIMLSCPSFAQLKYPIQSWYTNLSLVQSNPKRAAQSISFDPILAIQSKWQWRIISMILRRAALFSLSWSKHVINTIGPRCWYIATHQSSPWLNGYLGQSCW